jgi:hypothetical protein
MREKCGRRGREEKPSRKLRAIISKSTVYVSSKRPAVAATGELLRRRVVQELSHMLCAAFKCDGRQIDKVEKPSASGFDLEDYRGGESVANNARSDFFSTARQEPSQVRLGRWGRVCVCIVYSSGGR